MSYETQYTEEKFMGVLSCEVIKSTAAIMKTVGCSRNTAKVMLTKLEYEGKIKKITIEGNGYGWLKIENTGGL